MKAKIIFLSFILLLVFFGCSRQQEIQDTIQDTAVSSTNTPIDSEINGLDSENSDLNESELDSLDSDLETIENL